MGNYIPGTSEEQKEMLQAAGLADWEELFAEIPGEMRIRGIPELPDGLSEMEVIRKMEGLAAKNRVFRTVLRGAGAYRHYIPAAVKKIASREEWTAVYTPYQPEINQGILQALFEYQTMICELTGMDVSNNSMYDGASAAAEGLLMCRDKKRSSLFVSATVDPKVLDVIRQYCGGRNISVRVIPAKRGLTDPEALRKALEDAEEAPAGVYFQSPNYEGLIEPAEEICGIAHEAGALAVMGANPISLGLMKSPGELGADIAVGEGQPLGVELSYGGPYFGFLAARRELMRRMPGKIAGQTVDSLGRRAFTLTLQAREQHVRRERAGSNICTNQAHCAVRAAIYLSAMGPEGLRETALQCTSKAHYFCGKLERAGLKRKYEAEFFHEFVTVCGESTVREILWSLENQGILGGLPLGGGEILWCVTEMNTREELDLAADLIRGIVQEQNRRTEMEDALPAAAVRKAME